ncbi:MAG: hypothetical protein AB1938_07120 [Myxococcota bacterium]
MMRVGSASTMQRLRDSGGQLPTEPQQLVAAEGAVANNPGVNQEWSMAALKKDPRKFLRNVVQLDGALGSTLDRTACGPTSLLMGMISGRPESIQELAGKLVDAKGNLTGFGKNLAQNAVRGMKPEVREARAAEVREELQQAATRLRDGRAFTPADVTTLANCMQGVETLAGAAPNDLREAAIAIERLGVKVPPMELQLFGKPDGTMGHWRVVSRGTQFNPWPNDKGQSTQLPAKQGLESGKRDGAGWVLRDTVTVGSD